MIGVDNVGYREANNAQHHHEKDHFERSPDIIAKIPVQEDQDEHERRDNDKCVFHEIESPLIVAGHVQGAKPLVNGIGGQHHEKRRQEFERSAQKQDPRQRDDNVPSIVHGDGQNFFELEFILCQVNENEQGENGLQHKKRSKPENVNGRSVQANERKDEQDHE